MVGGDIQPLRLLVADGRQARMDEVVRTVAGLGHEVVAQATLADVAALTGALQPDLALVVVSEGSETALDLIRTIVREAACPVIAVLDVQDRSFVNEAARLGIFAYITDGESGAEFQSSIDIALRRFTEYHELEGAFGRRAVTERAKGILMERHGVDEQTAFEMLRGQARNSGRKVVDVARAVTSAHQLLPAKTETIRSSTPEPS